MAATRRMFSQRIANSARFLKMSHSAQNLYFHFGMRADDDGIVEAFPIMQMLGAAEDDFKVLVAKGFIVPLNEDLVTYILDWKEHNLIRADRKVNSIYKDLLLRIVPEADLISPKPRADTGVPTGKASSGRPLDATNDTCGRPMDSVDVQCPPMDGIGKDRLGKVRRGKDKQGEREGMQGEREVGNSVALATSPPSPSEEMQSFIKIPDAREHIISWLVEKSVPDQIARRELDKFLLYWTERNKSGTKMRWQMEPTFELKRRLATWFNRLSESKNKEEPKAIRI